MSLPPNNISIASAVFAGLTFVPNTNTQTTALCNNIT